MNSASLAFSLRPEVRHTTTPASFAGHDRSLFSQRLEQRFLQRDRFSTSFLLVVLYAREGLDNLDRMISVLPDVLEEHDDFMADPGDRCAVVMLHRGHAKAAQSFSMRLYQQLRKHLGTQAPTILNNLCMTFIPDGCGFEHADDFLTSMVHDA